LARDAMKGVPIFPRAGVGILYTAAALLILTAWMKYFS